MRAELTAGQASDYEGYDLLHDEDLPALSVSAVPFGLATGPSC